MSATLANDHGGRHRRFRRATDWAGHHWIVFVLAGIATAPFLDMLPHSWARTTATLGLVAVIGPAVLLGAWHDARLCERCAARMPLNGDESAARYARRLHLVHIQPLWFAFLLAGTVVSFLPSGWAESIVEVAVTPLPIYGWVASRTHRQLYPWCPRCHWGDGGDGFKEPSPDPSIDTPTPLPV